MKKLTEIGCSWWVAKEERNCAEIARIAASSRRRRPKINCRLAAGVISNFVSIKGNYSGEKPSRDVSREVRQAKERCN